MNMSYCMFENTVNAIGQCRSQLIEEGFERTEAEAGEYERPHVLGLVELCRKVVAEFDEGEYGTDEMDADTSPLEADKAIDVRASVEDMLRTVSFVSLNEEEKHYAIVSNGDDIGDVIYSYGDEEWTATGTDDYEGFRSTSSTRMGAVRKIFEFGRNHADTSPMEAN